MKLSEISLHDGTLVSAARSGSDLRLAFEDATLSNGDKGDISIVCANVSEIVVDSARVEILQMKSDDCEVLRAAASESELSLLVQWNWYMPRASEISRIRVLAQSIALQD